MNAYRQLQQEIKQLRAIIPKDKQHNYKLNSKKDDLISMRQTLLDHVKFTNWVNQLKDREQITGMIIKKKSDYQLLFNRIYNNLPQQKILIVSQDGYGRKFEVTIDTANKSRQAYSYLAKKMGFDSDGEVDSEFVVDIYKQLSLDEWATDLKQQQRFKIGEMNCLVKPLIDWYSNKRDSFPAKSSSWSRYNRWLNYLIEVEIKVRENGITIELIKEICQKLSANIFVKNLLNNERIVEKCTGNARKNFVFYNTKFEHVDEYFNEKQPEVISHNEINQMYDKLILEHQSFMYKKSLDSISYILYGGKSYINETIQNLKMIYERFQNQHDHALVARYSQRQFEFMCSQITSNGRILVNKLKKNKQLHQYDQNQAFSQYKKTGQYYMQFPIPTQFRKTPTKDPQFAINNIGNYECILNLSNSTKIAKLLYKNNNSTVGLTSPDIKFLLDQNAQIQLIAGCWGSETYDFDFPQEMIDKFMIDPVKEYQIRPFSIWTGRQQIQQQESAIYLYCEDPSLVYQSSDRQNEQFYEENDIYKNGLNSYKCMIKKQPNSVYSRIHIATYILAYQRINLALQLSKMDLKQIHRIHTDGIYTHQLLNQDQITPTYRKDDVKKIPDAGVQDSFISQSNIRVTDFPDFRDIRKTTKCEGLGGSGKTHINLIDEGLISVLFVAPSNKLMASKRQDYKQYNHKYTNYAILKGTVDKDGKRQFLCAKYNPRNIIMDESSLISIDTVKYTIQNYQYSNIICCGDSEQLKYFEKDDEDEYEYDLDEYEKLRQTPQTALDFDFQKTYNFTISHRCLDPLLANVLNDIRNKKQTDIPQDRFIKLENFIQNPNNYDEKSTLICATRKLRDFINKNLQTNIKKYRVIKKHRFEDKVYYNGDYIIIDDISQLKMLDGKNKSIDRPLLYQHAGTCHSLQGITSYGNLFVCIRDISWADGYLYTALSRAQYLNQIYILY